MSTELPLNASQDRQAGFRHRRVDIPSPFFKHKLPRCWRLTLVAL